MIFIKISNLYRDSFSDHCKGLPHISHVDTPGMLKYVQTAQETSIGSSGGGGLLFSFYLGFSCVSGIITFPSSSNSGLSSP